MKERNGKVAVAAVGEYPRKIFSMMSFAGEAPQFDDITVVVLRIGD